MQTARRHVPRHEPRKRAPREADRPRATASHPEVLVWRVPPERAPKFPAFVLPPGEDKAPASKDPCGNSSTASSAEASPGRSMCLQPCALRARKPLVAERIAPAHAPPPGASDHPNRPAPQLMPESLRERGFAPG